jgi:membrane protein YqaA with SNARE-associated domain
VTFFSFLNNLLTWWGAILLGALDSSLFVFIPFGNDAVVVYLCARDPSLFWLYPLLVTAGSVAGAAGTYLIGVKIGDEGLSRFVAKRRLERLRKRVKGIGAFVLTSGALKVGMTRFFLVFTVARLIRFGIEAALARRYGTSVLRVLESNVAQQILIGLVILSIVGTVAGIVQAWRSTQPAPS